LQTGSNAFRFSTAGLRDHERVEIWREVFGKQVVKVDMEPIGEAPFASQGGREATFSAGEAILWSNARTGSCSYATPIDFISLTIPRATLRASIADLDKAEMAVIPRDVAALNLLGSYVKILQAEADGMSPELLAVSANHIHDLVSLAVGATREAAVTARGRGGRAARLHAIKMDIIANVASRDLTIDSLAQRHGISPRYIRSLFQAEHTCFTDFVLEQRLALAHRRLRDGRFIDCMISTIAFESGFGDLSYFNHAFRRRYGFRPSDLRALAHGTEQCGRA
jgi:AraC-like DNA-binding protein